MIPKGSLYNDKTRNGGEVAGHHGGMVITTGTAEGAIPFGRGIVKGTSENRVKLPASADDTFRGIAGFSFDAGNLDEETYTDADPVAVCKVGVFSVYFEEEIAEGAPVRLRIANSGSKKAGDFCTSAEAGKTVKLTNVEVTYGTSGPGFGVIRIDGAVAMTADS